MPLLMFEWWCAILSIFAPLDPEDWAPLTPDDIAKVRELQLIWEES